MYATNGNGKVEENPSTRPYLDCETHDAGHAMCLYLTVGQYFRFNKELGWVYWNGRFWEREGAEQHLDLAITKMLQQRVIDLVRAGRGDEAKKCIPNASKIGATRTLFDELVYTKIEAFDADPFLLNCENGVIDLRTKTLEPHNPSQLFTYCVNAPYNPDADTTTWVEWLRTVLDDPDHVVPYAQVLFGYCFTGLTREELFVYMWGERRAGKGTLMETLQALAGKPLSYGAMVSTFTARRSGGDQNFDLAPMRSSRFVVASETEDTDWLNAAKIKTMTGGDQITCAYKYGDQFSYRPRFKIIIQSNYRLQTDAEDNAVWSRARVLHFPHTWEGNEDKQLKEKMIAPSNLEKVLKWIVDGAAEYLANGLHTPDHVRKQTAAAREEVDYVGKWLVERCERIDGSRDIYTANALLYKNYVDWCEDSGVSPKKQRGFSNSLQQKGIAASEPLRTPFKVERVVYGIKIL